MTTDREALLPCPFCGGRAEIQRGAYTKYVLCLKCAVMGPNLAADDELIAAWNRRAALSAQGGEQTDTVSVPRDLLHCTLLLFRGALDCKDWIWSPDQWEAGDTWCKELQAMLAAAKEGKK